MRFQGPATAALALVLAACAPSGVTASQAQPRDKETTGMDIRTPANDDGAPTAPQLLEGLLRLIESSASVKDFTPERVETALGVPIEVSSESQWGGSGKIDAQWWYGVSMEHAGSDKANFTFTFPPDQDGASPSMTPICGLDRDAFAARLEEAGMTREPSYGEHGALLSETFRRPDLEVEVLARGEADSPDEKVAHQCVEMVVVR